MYIYREREHYGCSLLSFAYDELHLVTSSRVLYTISLLQSHLATKTTIGISYRVSLSYKPCTRFWTLSALFTDSYDDHKESSTYVCLVQTLSKP